MSVASQETVTNAVTSTAPPVKDLNAETVTTMATAFLKRIGHKGGLKPRRVSLEGEVYTVEVETKKFTAVVRIGSSSREIREYDVQPKSEENSFSVNLRMLIIVVGISAGVAASFHFIFPMLGL
jgi:hypothetical protein